MTNSGSMVVSLLLIWMWLGAPAAGERVTVQYKGTITFASDCPAPLDVVDSGQAWSLAFTYDASAADTDAAADSGFYPGAVEDFSVQAGPFVREGPAQPGLIWVRDDDPTVDDQILFLVDDEGDIETSIALEGASDVLASDALPTDCSLLDPASLDPSSRFRLVDNADMDCSIGGDIESFACAGSGGHYQCYRAQDLKRPKFAKVEDVLLEDQFGRDLTDVRKPFQVCVPVDKDGEGIDDPGAFLCCYKQKAQAPKPAPEVRTTDQLGTLELRLKKPQVLCAPCIAEALEP